MTSQSRLLKGILLVSGTSIGGGMLALPVLTSVAGFLPSLVVYLLCWLFMASTGLLLLEVSFWVDKDANMVSMAGKTLGRFGKYATWVLYLFLFYCLTLAYVVGCGNLVSRFIGPAVSEAFGPLIFVLLAAPVIFSGTGVVSRINLWCMAGLIFFYFTFVAIGATHINPAFLSFQSWPHVINALPIAFTAFAYQGIIPTLARYMHRDIKQTRLAIIIGSFIPLVIYVVWQALILGIVPLDAPGGLRDALENGDNAVFPLRNFIQSPSIYIIGQFFAFFSLITSFFGVTLGLLDFLSDGLKVKKTPLGKMFLCVLIFLPTLLIASSYPHIFLVALDYAGGFGCALLLGFLPIIMVWKGRYQHHFSSDYALLGGKAMLLALLLFVILEVGIQFFLVLGQVIN